LKAVSVLIATMGFMIGAESMYVTAQDSGSPFCTNRRITGTTAHSHTGNTSPRKPAISVASTLFLGSTRSSSLAGRKASMIPEKIVPMRM
jgi:hypothetical protein